MGLVHKYAVLFTTVHWKPLYAKSMKTITIWTLYKPVFVVGIPFFVGITVTLLSIITVWYSISF